MINIKKHRRLLARRLIGNKFDLAYYFCKGSGIEVGAMSSPYPEFSSDTQVKYADMFSSTELRNIISSLNVDGMYDKKIVDTDILLKAPTYSLFDCLANKVDFIYSSNVFEHYPNPIFSLVDQLNCVVTGGIVYLVIPNKNFTYDRLRKTTDINALINKYENKNFKNTVEEALEVITDTDSHPVYDEYKKNPKKYSQEMIDKKEGIHHFYTYNMENVLELINYVKSIISFELIYISADESSDIHVTLKKTS